MQTQKSREQLEETTKTVPRGDNVARSDRQIMAEEVVARAEGRQSVAGGISLCQLELAVRPGERGQAAGWLGGKSSNG